jgi:hypothetical protein
VGSDGKIALAIGKTTQNETYYLKGIVLSRQPDGEYAEFVNLSDRDVDMSGWVIEGELTGQRQAKLPQGSLIKAHGYLIAAVDLDDEQAYKIQLAESRLDADFPKAGDADEVGGAIRLHRVHDLAPKPLVAVDQPQQCMGVEQKPHM